MCGIVGFTGHRQAAGILLDGLSKLEYRGYDSAGLAVLEGDGNVKVMKATGKLRNLDNKSGHGALLPGLCGIGHTRWATHGEPNEMNAHPHLSSGPAESLGGYTDADVVGVHNGIIENQEELREKLLRHGYTFYSDTDTEVAIKTVDYYLKKYRIGPIDAINRMMVRVRGSYALALMFKDYPGEVYAARKDSPLIIGEAGGESFLASDVPAILKYTRTVYYIGNYQAARILPGEVHFFDLNGDEITISPVQITWDAKSAEKGGYEHFMMKEIHEQPEALRRTLNHYLHSGEIDFSEAGLTDEILRNLEEVCIVACGSAWHVGMTAQYVIEDMAEVPVRVELASEFRYRKILPRPGTLVIVISQSGETADSLEALRLARGKGLTALAIVNVLGSSIAREADTVLYTMAGPEIAVATTKAFTAQLIVMYMLAVRMAYVRGMIHIEDYRYYVRELETLPDKASSCFLAREHMQRIAARFAAARDAFFIGREADYAISLEGSLKMKEISYVHSEAYAAGEMKHGTISLVENGTLIVGVLTQKKVMEKTISNMSECKARGAFLLGITDSSEKGIEAHMDDTVHIPETDEHFSGILAVIPLQLLGYYSSVSRGLDVDKPRNLAKSVTVE